MNREEEEMKAIQENMQEENQKSNAQVEQERSQKKLEEEKEKSTYQLRDRTTLQAPQRFTYLCQKSLTEPTSYNEALQALQLQYK